MLNYNLQFLLLLSITEVNVKCPKCPSTKAYSIIKKLNPIEKAYIKTSFANDGTLETGVELDKFETAPFLKCKGCGRQFIEYEIEPQYVLNEIEYDESIETKIVTHYKEKIKPEILISNHYYKTTRNPDHRHNLVKNFLKKITGENKSPPFFIAVDYKGKKTCAMIQQKKDKVSSGSHYVIVDWADY